MLRLAAIVLALNAFDTAQASACPISRNGYTCKKNRPHPEPFEEPVIGYASTVRGSTPSWSYDRVAAFLARARWDPITDRESLLRVGLIRPGEVIWVKPPRIVFATADAAAEMHIKDSIVLLRRIEKKGAAILVDVDGFTYRLTTCPRRPGYACLVQTTLDFDPIEPADAVPAP